MRARILFACIVVGALTGYPSSQSRDASGPAMSGQIIVKFRPGVNASEKAIAHRQAGGISRAAISRTGVELVAVAPGSEAASIARYQRSANILHAEPNFIRSIPQSDIADLQLVPADYYFDEEWGLHNTGQMFQCFPSASGKLCSYVGTPDADIDAPEAWKLSVGSPNVRVAVIDTGIDYNHPDLAANYLGGHDFVFNDADPLDDHGHGTHVAGTIAAAIDNRTGDPEKQEGVVGVAPYARILAYKACRADGTCDDFAIQRAIAQAITDGANVINMSVGGYAFSQSLNAAVQDAWNEGLVIVAAAGNNGGTSFFYPAALDNVVSVAAFDENHRRASYSNYGSWVDISAPGNTILSAYRMAACGGSSNVPGSTGCYAWLTGTSMAAPHVAGAAALLWSRADVTRNSDVVKTLLQSADAVGVAATRLDSWTIHGGLNVFNAVSVVSDSLSVVPANQSPVANAGSDQTKIDIDGSGGEAIMLDGHASSDPDGSIESYEWRENGVLVAYGATPNVFLSVGTHTLTLSVKDNLRADATDTTVITVLPAGSAADTVVILKATLTRRGVLTIEATSNGGADVSLKVFDISGGADREMGELAPQSHRRKYTGSFTVLTNPDLIEVRSSGRGSDTSIVSTK